MRTRILHCGTNASLLSTRSAVLRSVGWDVLTTSRLDEVEATMRVSSIDALVLCHSLKPEQQKAAIALQQRHAPAAKSVLLTQTPAPETVVDSDVVVSTMEGPEVLIDSLGHLLHHV